MIVVKEVLKLEVLLVRNLKSNLLVGMGECAVVSELTLAPDEELTSNSFVVLEFLRLVAVKVVVVSH